MLNRYRTLSYLLIGVFVLHNTIHKSTVLGQTVAPQPKDQRQACARLIDALASRNPAPKIVQLDISHLPIFVPDYDWNDETRVRQTLSKIYNDPSEAMWEELVNHIPDKRYALTYFWDDHYTINGTVGDWCETIVQWRLYGPVGQYDLSSEREGRSIHLVDDVYDHLIEWRKARAHKPLVDLQIEICELSIKRIPAVEDLTPEEKRTMIKQVTAQMESLKRTRKPLMFEGGSLDSIGGYNARRAQEIRDKYAKKK